MEKVNVEQLLCDIYKQCTYKGEYRKDLNMEVDLVCIDKALKNQGLEYDNDRGEIVKVNT